MATSTDVETLERETAEARVRLADTLDRLTSQETADAVKQELTDYAQGWKDKALGYRDNVIGTGRDRANDLKDRALANPLGLALIGAGIGYRLYRHPPIATLLIGAGVAAIMKGGSPRLDPNTYRNPYDPIHPGAYVPGGVAGYGYPVEEEAPGSSITDRASAAASAAASRTSELAQDLGGRARDLASDATDRVSGAVESARTSVTSAAEAAMTAAGDAVQTARTAVMDATERARMTVSEAAASARTAMSEMAERTTSTITDTADYATRRVSGLTQQAQANPWVLGALGLAVGTALVYSLRSTEAADRTTGARRAYDEGARGMGSRSRRAARRTARSTSDMAAGASERLGSMASRASDTAGDLVSSAADTASGVAGAASRMLGAAGETVSSSASGAVEAASSAYRSAADLAASAGRRAPQAASRVQQQISELSDRYPLLLGAVTLAVGAAVGGSLRLTEGEQRLMGPLSDQLKQRAREMAGEQFSYAREAAEHFAGELGAQLGATAEDKSADFETVIGGGKPAVASTTGDGTQGSPGGARSPTYPL